MSAPASIYFSARVQPGHRVASGQNGNPRFPGGTLRMQAPHFRQRGFDIGHFYIGTVNVSIAPWRYQVVKPKLTFKNLQWHPTEPAEDFSFFDVNVQQDGSDDARGYVYYPHPETKPEHFQAPDVLELLLPFLPSIHYGDVLKLAIPPEQMRVELAAEKSN